MRKQLNANRQNNEVQVTKMYHVQRGHQSGIYSERQLSFRKDSQNQLVKKFCNKRYSVCRSTIIGEFEYKRNNTKKRLNKMIDNVFQNRSMDKKLLELKTKYDGYTRILDHFNNCA